MEGRVLVVDDEKAMVLALKGLLGKEGYHVETAGSGEEALRRIETGSFHVVITDLSMNGVGGMQVLEHAKRVDPDLAVVMITAYGSEKIAVQAMKLGAVDYVPKPFDNDELRLVVRRVMDTVLLRRDHRRLLEQVERAFGFEQIVGQSPAMRRLFETIDKIADTDVTVLIRGASGTGTRWAPCRSRRRRSSCAPSRRRSSSGWAGTCRSGSTCGSSPPPTRTSRAPCAPAASARTSTTACASSSSPFRRSPSGARTSRC